MSKSISSRLPLFILLSFLAAIVVYLMWPQEVVERQRHQRVVPVKAVTAEKLEFRDVIEAIGTSRAAEEVQITSKYSDIVDEIFFNDGQLVKKGDVLVQLNKEEEEAKVRELQANLAESVAQFNRFQDLLKQKATAKSLVDQKEAQVKAIAAQVNSANAKLEYLTIKAPFDGVLGFRQISVGAYLGAGDIITSIDDLSTIKVDFAIPERFLSRLSVGQSVSASTVAYQENKFKGKITSISARIDPKTRTITVRAEVPNPDAKLRPGMLIRIFVERNVDLVLQVPESAVIPIEDKHYIYVVEDETAKRKTVELGRRQPGIVEIIGGLDEGEQVVVEGALKLREGAKVNILETAL